VVVIIFGFLEQRQLAINDDDGWFPFLASRASDNHQLTPQEQVQLLGGDDSNKKEF
jgi:hypothetical protein